MMKKYILLLIFPALLGMGYLAGCGAASKEAGSTMQAEVTNKPGIVYLMAGKVEANSKVDISSKITARVAETKVEVGAAVKQGDPVIRLDAKDIESQVAQVQAALSQAQASLAGAKANYENARVNYERNNQLFQAGAISASALEQFKNALNAAGTAQSVCQSQLEQAQAALNTANIQMDNSTIVSPISGIISAKNINTGELAAAGVPLLTVVNPEGLLVNAYLPANLINQVKAGQEVTIKISEIPEREYKGEIAVIDAVIDSKTKNVLVKIRFKNPDAQLKPGMFAEISVAN